MAGWMSIPAVWMPDSWLNTLRPMPGADAEFVVAVLCKEVVLGVTLDGGDEIAHSKRRVATYRVRSRESRAARVQPLTMDLGYVVHVRVRPFLSCELDLNGVRGLAVGD